MAKFLLARKVGMTQVFLDDGTVVPVTVVKAPALVALREKTPTRDGYQAIQFGFELRRDRRVAKPQRGEWKELGAFARVREARGMEGLDRGAKLDCTQFSPGDVVKVSGISKGKGFQGVVKRHGFHGAPKTHGTKHAHREPGSIGATWPQRVIKGRRMAGRMGGGRTTVRNLEIVKIDPDRNLIAVKGAVPGRRGSLLEIRG